MLFLIVLFASASFAEEGSICGNLTNPNDVLECVKTRSPEVQSLIQEQEGTLSEAKAARRWLNPQVTNQTLMGKNLGSEQYNVQVGLFQTFEFGSKRSYKNTLAESLEKRAGADFQIGLGQDLIKTGTDLVRLIQLKTEIASVEEAIGTFDRLVGQFANRPRLSPEQEVTAAVYKLSKGDFLVRKNSLIREQQEILIRFKSKLDLTEESIDKLSPGLKLNLPDIGLEIFPEQLSPEIKVVDADLTSAIANLNLVKSDVFSEVQFGPMAQFDADGPSRSQMVGFQLNFPLPLWNQNGHGINAAAQKLKAAEIRSVVQKRAVKEEWVQLIKNYQRLRVLLETVPSTDEIESRHKKVENQIYRGLVNSALVVESHRSLVDLQKSRHESEIAALTNLWHIYIIQGKISEIRI